MNDFRAEPASLRTAMAEAVHRVFESGWYVLGPEVEEFEANWARLCGVDYCVGVGSGLDAIEISLRTLDIGPGDEVLTTPMTAFATVLAIVRAGGTPVLADIAPDSALLSIESASRCVTERTKAMVLVHLYGQVKSMGSWLDFCQERDIALVEDCAQAHLASWHGRIAGSFGLVGAYSFYPTKNLGTAGDAGMLVTNDEAVAQRAGRLRNYGQSVRYYHSELGMNSRLDEIHAAILAERLKWLPQFTERRREIAEIYRTNIVNSCINHLAPPEEAGAHVHHLFVIKCEHRDALQKHLQRQQVQSLIHYPIPIHHQDPCRDLTRDPAGLRYSEEHAGTCLSLPCHPQMSEGDIQQVVAAVNSFKGA